MIQAILDFLFGAQLYGYDVVTAPIGAAMGSALIGAGGSLLGGLLGGIGNNRQQIEVPDELNNQIEDLQDPNFFFPLLERLSDNEQGNFNINAQLAESGVDSPAIRDELQQAGERRSRQSIQQGMDRLEPQRLGMLNNLIGQKAGINRANARLGQQHNQNRMNIISETVGGATGSIVQGLGAKIAQQNFDKFLDQSNQQTGQVGGLGFGNAQGSASMFDMMMNGNSFGDKLV